VKGLIELHGGSVRAESAGPGRGSAFELRLALSGSDAAAEGFATEDPVSGHSSRTERVLLIDDNEDITDLFSTYLELSGFDVRTAHDGPSALRVAATYKPTVAILDLGLPVMDGYEIAAKLVEQLGGSAPRLIAMSGYGRKDDLERTRLAGFEKHLVKPVDANLLLRAISQREPASEPAPSND
jgi:CheY-like chemotaxis protein